MVIPPRSRTAIPAAVSTGRRKKNTRGQGGGSNRYRAVNPSTAEEAAMAKVWCSEQQWKIVDECLQLFGGYGYMQEYPICHFMMDARIQRLYGGSNEVLKDLIARKL